MRIRMQVPFLLSLAVLLSDVGCRAPERAEQRVNAPPPGNSSEELDAVEAHLSTLLGSPAQVFGVDTYAAAATDDFYVGVLTLVASDALEPPFQCFQNHHNPILFGETFEADFVSCGPREVGPWAEGMAILTSEQDWLLRVRAAASGGTSDDVATGYVNAQWRDVFTVVGNESDPTALVPVAIRLRHRRDIENPPFSFLRFELEVQRVGGPSVHYQRRDYGIPPPGDPATGTHEFEQNIPIGEFEPGTRLRVSAALDAVAESGGDYGTLVDPKVAEADVSVSLCSAIAGAVLQGASGSTGDCGATGDLRIDGPPQLVQSIFHAPKMIADKGTVIAVDITSTFDSAVSANVAFEFDQPGAGFAETYVETIDVPANCTKRYFFPRPTGQPNCESSEAGGDFAALGLAPRSGGPLSDAYSVAVTAELLEDVDEEPSNNAGATGAPVTETALTIGWARLECASACDEFVVSEAAAIEAKRWSDAQILGMYPIASTTYDSQFCLNGGEICTVRTLPPPCPPGIVTPTCGIAVEAREMYEHLVRWSSSTPPSSSVPA